MGSGERSLERCAQREQLEILSCVVWIVRVVRQNKRVARDRGSTRQTRAQEASMMTCKSRGRLPMVRTVTDVCLLLLLHPIAAASASCDVAEKTANSYRQRAAELYAASEHASADICMSLALKAVTEDLEVLAAQAQALRSFARGAAGQSSFGARREYGLCGRRQRCVCLPTRPRRHRRVDAAAAVHRRGVRQ